MRWQHPSVLGARLYNLEVDTIQENKDCHVHDTSPPHKTVDMYFRRRTYLQLTVLKATPVRILETRHFKDLQSNLLKRDVKITAERSRLEQNPSTVVICMEIGLKRQKEVSRLDQNPA
jgi:hypothetical protein